MNKKLISLPTISMEAQRTSRHLSYDPDPENTKSKGSLNKLEKIQKKALLAAHDHKIFTMIEDFPEIRKALLSRHWVQKILPHQYVELSKASKASLLLLARENNPQEIVLISNLLKDFRPYLVWNYASFDKVIYYDHPYYSMLAPHPREFDFTQKDGLTNIYNQVYWYELGENSDFIYPRCYLLSDDAEKNAFRENFRLTYCTGFLHFLSKLPNLEELFGTTGDFSSDCVDFALEVVQRAIDKKNHYDIEDDFIDLEYECRTYREFNDIFQKFINSDSHNIRITNSRRPFQYALDVRNTVNIALTFFPYIPRDGHRNIWIVKPVGPTCCCGYGIACMKDEEEIFKYAAQGLYLAQKYLERPLLVYNTKFDIRQYFLISMDTKFMSVWMYKNCYLKFSSQEFNLEDLAQSIHVTNHTVQKQYTNGPRHPKLPTHNMWVLNEFKEYLSSIKKTSLWDNQIYPGMKRAIQTIFNGTLEHLSLEANNFQLFGADFMITEDFLPILIEINQYPDLRPSTISTSVVCGAVQRDLIRVIVDYDMNHRSSTGDFELIWRHSMINDKDLPNMQLVGSAKPTNVIPQLNIVQNVPLVVENISKQQEHHANFDWNLIKLLKQQITEKHGKLRSRSSSVSSAASRSTFFPLPVAPNPPSKPKTIKVLQYLPAAAPTPRTLIPQPKLNLNQTLSNASIASVITTAKSVQKTIKKAETKLKDKSLSISPMNNNGESVKFLKRKKDIQNLGIALEKSMRYYVVPNTNIRTQSIAGPRPSRTKIQSRKVSNQLIKHYNKYMQNVNKKAQNREIPTPLTPHLNDKDGSAISTSIYFRSKQQKDNANNNTIKQNTTTSSANTISLTLLEENHKKVVEKLKKDKERTKEIFKLLKKSDLDTSLAPFVTIRESNELTSGKTSKKSARYINDRSSHVIPYMPFSIPLEDIIAKNFRYKKRTLGR